MAFDRGSLALGLDGGGTKTEAVVSWNSSALGRGRAGACNLAAASVRLCLQSAIEASAQALEQAGAGVEDIGAVCAGVAGASYQRRAASFHRSLSRYFPHARISILPDYVTAHRGALSRMQGVIVIAGTGSVAYGEDANGKAHRAGAYGYLIDDAGSGYGVGRGAIAAVMRAADGTGEMTGLSERVLSHLELGGVSEIVPAIYGKKIDRVTIASLAEVVASAASEDGDIVAASLLGSAGAALARLTDSVLLSLFHGAVEPVPIVCIGSLWNSGAYLLDAYSAAVNKGSVPFMIRPAEESPVMGAVQSAMEILPT